MRRSTMQLRREILADRKQRRTNQQQVTRSNARLVDRTISFGCAFCGKSLEGAVVCPPCGHAQHEECYEVAADQITCLLCNGAIGNPFRVHGFFLDAEENANPTENQLNVELQVASFEELVVPSQLFLDQIMKRLEAEDERFGVKIKQSEILQSKLWEETRDLPATEKSFHDERERKRAELHEKKLLMQELRTSVQRAAADLRWEAKSVRENIQALDKEIVELKNFVATTKEAVRNLGEHVRDEEKIQERWRKREEGYRKVIAEREKRIPQLRKRLHRIQSKTLL